MAARGAVAAAAAAAAGAAPAGARWSSTSSPVKAVFLNAGRLNYDDRLNFDRLSSVADLTNYDKSSASEPEVILSRVQDATVVITKEMAVGGDLIRQFPPSVRLICEAGTGYNNIDLDAASSRGIAVTNVPTYSTEAMATMTITFILTLSCSMVPQQQMLWQGNNQNFATECLGGLPHFEVGGKVLGLIGGLGTIGNRVTHMADALGLEVIASSRRATLPANAHPAVKLVSLEELLRRSDFVSIQCPLNAETRGLIGAQAFELMKPTAYLINTARGAIIDQDALCHALSTGSIAGAALDVHTVEPLPEDNPLRQFPADKVILTPHIGWQRIESRQRLVDAVAENIGAFVRGEPVNIVG